MKTEELNNLWEIYNNKLDKSLALNEQLLRKVNMDGMKKELAKPITSEIFSIVFTCLLIIYLVVVSVLLSSLLRFSIPGFIAAGSAIALVGFAIGRVNTFKNLDYVNSSVLMLQKDLYELQRKRSRSGRLELFLGICSATLMWPLVLYTGFEIDVYESVSAWLLTVSGVALIALPVTILHEKYYRKKIKNAEALLIEIGDLETES